MYLTQGLHRALQQKPEALATVCGTRRHSFAQLASRVARLAGGLQGLGVKTGDRVAILSPNSDRYLEYFLAVYWAGAVVNPVNTRWSAAEIAYSLEDSDNRLLLLGDPFVAMAPELRRLAPGLRELIYCGDEATPAGMRSYEALIEQSAPVADARRNGDDLAGVFYTGGTTGFPKGVMLSQRALYVNALTLLSEGLIKDRCVGLHAAPMFHIADCAFMNALLASGSRHVFIPSFTPQATLETIDREQVSAALLVPTMIQMMIDSPQIDQYLLSSLRSLMYGASPISEALLERAMARLPGVEFVQAYGMTELAPVATVLPPWYHSEQGRPAGKLRSAGRATFCTEVRIVDPEDDRELPRGEVGEIIVCSPSVMQGYWKKEKETAAALRGGWMHTGDMGYMDSEGFVFVVDRLKDMIVTGGENVYSVEVENALVRHPALATCAVIGIPDPRWGEAVHAVVVLKAGASVSEDELRAHCHTLIANYKCPRSFQFVEALPLSGAGKVLKNKLREPFWQQHSRRVS
ncbi:Acyl-CoA synthetase (AMP-forming)/AMP-acid ligase II [Solimonas aquatica]|uniref:Acyl-CoA synthetase (AMP-forming)/AMP-acid ligase II n=1 Tax=Solimonas aquatica TaxID=489703 RepID=A0A1H9GC09_9GAMM|nr:long-chain fatty acid--CoA ligase [Solimonas aquatica]SEQ47632.1 Acyl-CoA synthetase (AMP-forming)/AMP-acid ligase II [Solimonas aquatica]